MPDDDVAEPNSGDEETVPATSYITRSQYQHWQEEAKKRNQSISAFISTMVAAGHRQISIEDGSPSEIVELRQEVQKLQSEKRELKERLDNSQQRDYQVGLGKIKDMIIKNPGIDKRELTNYISENTYTFVNRYLESLEESEFREKNGRWYPPENMGDN